MASLSTNSHSHSAPYSYKQKGGNELGTRYAIRSKLNTIATVAFADLFADTPQSGTNLHVGASYAPYDYLVSIKQCKKQIYIPRLGFGASELVVQIISYSVCHIKNHAYIVIL